MALGLLHRITQGRIYPESSNTYKTHEQTIDFSHTSSHSQGGGTENARLGKSGLENVGPNRRGGKGGT